MRLSEYRRHYCSPTESWHCVVDAGTMDSATIALLLHYTVVAGRDQDAIVDHRERTITQHKIVRYDVVGCRRLSPALNHIEQASQIASWLDTVETKGRPIRSTVNTLEIGAPAARSFLALRPRHFALPDSAEFLRSLLLARLNDGTLHIADDVTLRLGDLNCEMIGDARATAIGIWTSTQGVTHTSWSGVPITYP